MVTTGFSKPIIAKYSNTGSTVTYTAPQSLARGVSLVLDIDVADDNNFYADNELAETESASFTSGTATVTVDGMDNDAATVILGLPEPTDLTVGSPGTTVKMQGYGQGMNPPFVGFGCVRRTMMNGVTQYWPYILPKVKFRLPSDEMATQEDQIDWQTQELTATIFRDDTPAANWKVISEGGMSTEAEAVQAVNAFFGQAETIRMNSLKAANAVLEEEQEAN